MEPWVPKKPAEILTKHRLKDLAQKVPSFCAQASNSRLSHREAGVPILQPPHFSDPVSV